MSSRRSAWLANGAVTTGLVIEQMVNQIYLSCFSGESWHYDDRDASTVSDHKLPSAPYALEACFRMPLFGLRCHIPTVSFSICNSQRLVTREHELRSLVEGKGTDSRRQRRESFCVTLYV